MVERVRTWARHCPTLQIVLGKHTEVESGSRKRAAGQNVKSGRWKEGRLLSWQRRRERESRAAGADKSPPRWPTTDLLGLSTRWRAERQRAFSASGSRPGPPWAGNPWGTDGRQVGSDRVSSHSIASRRLTDSLQRVSCVHVWASPSFSFAGLCAWSRDGRWGILDQFIHKKLWHFFLLMSR